MIDARGDQLRELVLGDAGAVQNAARLDVMDDVHDLENDAGNPPQPLMTEGGSGDVGLPGALAPGDKPAVGTMSAADAVKLAAQVHDCDILIVSGSVTAQPVVARINAGQLKIGALVLLDRDGPPLAAKPPVPVLTIHYDIRGAAFLDFADMHLKK